MPTPRRPHHSPAPRPSSSARAATVLAVVLAATCAAPLGAAPSSGAVRPAASGALAAAATYAPSDADRRLRAELDYRSRPAMLGTTFGGTVIDVASGTVIWSDNGVRPLKPASTTKLVTATNALSVYGPAHRFTTTTRRGSNWRSVGLVGAGDPSLSKADLAVLASATASKVRSHGVRSVVLWADDHIFPAPTSAVGWRPGDVPNDVRAVRALVVDEHHAADTTLDAAAVFASLLKSRGVQVTSIRRARAPRGALLLGSVQGDRLDAIVTRMLQRSDNDHAEALHRLVALRRGYSTSWAGARLAQRSVLAREGLTLSNGVLYDGSGLSRSDRLSAVTLARIVANVFDTSGADLSVLRRGGLPLAGRTGTLSASAGRFVTSPSACAAGLVSAKTGTLRDAIGLAGYTTGTDGRLKAFAFLVNNKGSSLTVKRRVDVLAATVNGCY